MGERTAIEWAANADGSPGATWNPIVGCSVLSPGCANCYAMREAGGPRLGVGAKYAGLTQPSKAGPVWAGEVRLWEPALAEPLRRRKPTVWFVNSMGDLFHEGVSDGAIARVWDVMGRCPEHTFIVLTKRGNRMRSWVTRWADLRGEPPEPQLARGPEETRRKHPSGRGRLFADMLESMGQPPPGCAYPTFDWMAGQSWWPEVLPNVWLGVSAEDQARADERIPELLATPAAKRLVSCEPLLGSIILTRLRPPSPRIPGTLNALAGRWATYPLGDGSPAVLIRPPELPRLDWVIVGGESGPGARPMHPDWARKIRDDCAAAGVPFFFKQWGEWKPICEITDSDTLYHPAPEHSPEATRRPMVATDVLQLDGSRGDPMAWPSGAMMIFRIGKRRAGRELDGRTHNARPEIG